MKIVELIKSHRAKVGIIGMGYVGLPLSKVFSFKGFAVTGFDIDKQKVLSLNNNRSYIKHIPSSVIREMCVKYHFRATEHFSNLKQMDAIIICVPTPLTVMREPDLSYIVNTARSIRQNLRKGQLVVLESTTYPGTTDEVVKPILEETGLKCGKDFYLAFSPEREDPGNPKYSTEKIPKVVGGVNRISTDVAVLLYEQVVLRVVRVSSARVAESSKLLENIYRCVNIALVNELKMLFDRMGINIWEVIESASTKPFGFQSFYPGPGLGGHCIPIDPFYLSWKARQYEMVTRFIELSGEINISMPYYVVSKTMSALNERQKLLKGARIVILGMAYKKDVDDIRESPSLKLMELFLKEGARVTYNDPFIPSLPKLRHYKFSPLKSTPLSVKMLKKQDVVVISTDHTAYDYQWIVQNSSLVIDTRNATKNVRGYPERIVRA
ncbi:MAG: nucleotide sugar dehydrogenase [Planctomycetota bacterium]|nr:nucleotide sugar dehydrogenase [Planctomycetota bacterium]MDI6787657.1 nucleotide sugar dehydrogenase [Planctomycetota bacterium]